MAHIDDRIWMRWLPSFASFATKHPTGGAKSIYAGSNPGAGRPITIFHLASARKTRVSAY